MPESRGRLLFAAIAAGCVFLSLGYVGWAAVRTDGAERAPTNLQELRAITARPFVVFLTSLTRRPPYDQVAVAPLAEPGSRLLVGLSCDRVAMAGSVGICVRHSGGLAAGYNISYFGRDFQPYGSGTGSGLPSRARVSPSGRLASVTSFVQGDSYLANGGFSTAATIFERGSKRPLVRTLEQFRVLRDGRPFEPVNRNFWGVTFAGDRRFYATMGTGSLTFLVRGDLRRRVVATIHENVECPSLSPDGTRIAFKHREPSGGWRFSVLDLASGRVTPLAERRSIDDQLAWADPGHVLYAADGAVWIVPADGRGTPRRLLAAAASPTVVVSSARSSLPR